MSLEQQIVTLAEEKLTNPSHFIVDVVVSARKGPKKVLVIVDGDQGISIDDCAEVSRELSEKFDELGFFEDSYLLEVSTPGVDYPLKLKRQYPKHIGRKLRVKLADATVEGKLEAVNDDSIVLITESGSGKKKETTSTAINFSQIEKAFVLVSFK
jgi:ribosome maturation factor RimP